MKPPAGSPVPLARLMAIAYRHLVDDLHARLLDHGYTDVRPAYGYVLLAARETPITGADIAELLGVTKQAASKLVDAMEAGGYVERRPDGDDARAKRIALTTRGRRLLTTVEGIYRDVEADWAQVIGRRRLEAMRDDLRTVLEGAHGGVLPRIRPVT